MYWATKLPPDRCESASRWPGVVFRKGAELQLSADQTPRPLPTGRARLGLRTSFNPALSTRAPRLGGVYWYIRWPPPGKPSMLRLRQMRTLIIGNVLEYLVVVYFFVGIIGRVKYGGHAILDWATKPPLNRCEATSRWNRVEVNDSGGQQPTARQAPRPLPTGKARLWPHTSLARTVYHSYDYQ